MDKPTFKSYYIFEHPLENVFESVANLKRSDSIFSDIRSPTTIVKGFNTYTPGNQFYYSVLSTKIEFEVISFLNQDSRKCVRWRAKSNNLEYYCEYSLYICCSSGSTILEWIVDCTDIKMDTEMMQQVHNETMRRIDKFLSDQSLSVVKSNLVIKAERSSILKYILDLSLVNNSSKYFGQLKYSGESTKIGSKVIFDYTMFGFEYIFNVESLEISSKVKKWTYNLKTAASPFQAGIKEIRFTLYKIHNKKSVIEINHFFGSSLSKSKTNEIQQEQQQFLEDLLKSIETKESQSKTNIA